MESLSDKRHAVLARVREESKPGLVYVATRKDAECHSGELIDAGVAAAAYHAGKGHGSHPGP